MHARSVSSSGMRRRSVEWVEIDEDDPGSLGQRPDHAERHLAATSE